MFLQKRYIAYLPNKTKNASRAIFDIFFFAIIGKYLAEFSKKWLNGVRQPYVVLRCSTRLFRCASETPDEYYLVLLSITSS